MPVLINFKICDNAKECNGISACPPGAIYWDNNKSSIIVDNLKCINCSKCEDSCMVGAIKYARNNEEYEKFKKEIEDDTRKQSDLFVDRYGASPIHPAFLIDEKRFSNEVEESSRICVSELFKDEGIMCLLPSIPIKDIFNDKLVKYRKVKIESEMILSKYKIEKLPCLLFFIDGKFIGKIEGYFDQSKKEELTKKIKKILK